MKLFQHCLVCALRKEIFFTMKLSASYTKIKKESGTYLGEATFFINKRDDVEWFGSKQIQDLLIVLELNV